MARPLKNKNKQTDNDNLKDHGTKPSALTRGAAYPELQVDSVSPGPDSSSYDSKGKVVVGIRRLLRSRQSLEEGEVAAAHPDLMNGAKEFFRTWKEACYASGVNERLTLADGSQALRLTRQTRVRRESLTPDGKFILARNHTVELVVELMKKQASVKSPDFMKAYGPGAYSRMLTHFGRFAKALEAAEQKMKSGE